MHSNTLGTHNHQYMMLHKSVFLVLMAAAILILLVSPAFAMGTPMGDVLCIIVRFIYGNLGRALATLAVIIVGVGATLGKVSWGLAMTVAVGIAIIFNAVWIVDNLGLSGGPNCAI